MYVTNYIPLPRNRHVDCQNQFFLSFFITWEVFFSLPLLFYIVSFNVEFSYMHPSIIMSKISQMLLQKCILLHITLKNFQTYFSIHDRNHVIEFLDI